MAECVSEDVAADGYSRPHLISYRLHSAAIHPQVGPKLRPNFHGLDASAATPRTLRFSNEELLPCLPYSSLNAELLLLADPKAVSNAHSRA